MTHLPAVELVDLLRTAYGPSPEFEGACDGVARWAPEEGHVARGYTGACETLGDVEVVLLLAEPGDHLDGDAFPPGLDACDFVGDASANTRSNYEGCATQFHANMRSILDLLFPRVGLTEQLRKV